MECNYSSVAENSQMWNSSEIRNVTQNPCGIEDVILQVPNIMSKLCCPQSLAQISNILWLYISPILIIVGNITNCLSLVILWRPKLKRNIIRNELIALASSNLFIIDLSFLLKYLQFFDIDVHTDNEIACKITRWLFDPVGIFNSWLLVMVTIPRVGAVMNPILMRNPKHVNCSKKQLVFLLIICVLLESHTLYGHGLEYKFQSETNKTVLLTNCGMTNSTYKKFYHYWVILEIFFLNFIPNIFLFICNIVIAIKLKQHYSNTELFNNMPRPRIVHTRKIRAMQNLRLVFYTNTAFIICQTPMSLVYLIYEPWNKVNNATHTCTYSLLNAISTIVMYTKYSSDILCFAVISDFRKEILNIFKCDNKFKNFISFFDNSPFTVQSSFTVPQYFNQNCSSNIVWAK